MTERPIDIWRRKLEHLQSAEATTSDPAQQFTIREQIEEAKRRIVELESESRADDPGQPPPTENPPPPNSLHAGHRHAGGQQFDVFLSHNSQDKPVVRELASQMTARGLKVWLDEWELRPGLTWMDALEDIIGVCRSAAVCVGPNGFGPWEEPEMRALLRRFVKERRQENTVPIIPTLLPGAPDDIQLPAFLVDFTWVDLRDGITEEGLDRLQWGITGKKPTRRDVQSEKPVDAPSLDDVLLAYSNDRLAAWEFDWTNPDDPHRLVYYVPPHYSLVTTDWRESKRAGRLPKRSTPRDEAMLEAEGSMQRVPGATEEETLTNLLNASDRLCVSEGPGAGKSIFTRRLQAFLSSQAGRDALLGGKPVLAVRWEEWDGSWPDDFHASLARQLEPFCAASHRQAQSRALVEAALVDERVVLILDALDQVGTQDRVRDLSDFLVQSRRRGWTLRVVMTGRPFAVEQRKSTLLRDPAWQFACIEDFDAEQQYRYLYGPETPEDEMAKTSEAWRNRDLSGVEIKRLVSQADLSTDNIDEGDRHIHSALSGLFPNYNQVSDLVGNPAVLEMVRGLAEDNELAEFERRGDLYARTSEVMIQRAAELLGEALDATAIEKIEAVLAAVACEMMVRDPNTYRLDGSRNVARLRQGAAGRIAGGIGDEQWRRIEALTGLTNRSLLYGASHSLLAWHHKGMMEFYCGLHLAKNSQPGWCAEDADEQGHSWPGCGDADIRQAAFDPQWHWAFRFAIEMDEQLRHPPVHLASLSTLFQTPKPQTQHRRPTELMQRAWCLLEELPKREWSDTRQPVLIPGGGPIIEQFRSQFRKIVDDVRHPQHDVAAGLLDAFVACPPDEFVKAWGDEKDPYTFMIGAADEEEPYDWEQPQHPVRVTPFQLMSTPVTRWQFSLFDPSHEHQDEGVAKYSPEPGCPAIYVSWYDAWCFARWLGAEYRLPSEAEWECGCRAGDAGKWCFGSDERQLGEYAWYGEPAGSTHPVATKKANSWGLYDMHGNVWEWCADWFDERYYETSPADDPQGPDSGSDRVARGGCWRNSARDCRSAYRFRNAPSNRFSGLGFRLALVPSSQDQGGGAGSGGP